MKCKIFWFCATIMVLTISNGFAQQSIQEIKSIKPLELAITDKKTTNLIFPFAVRSVDRGNNEVLVQKANKVENILQLKAASGYFENTNLTVITSDGKLYSFLLYYQSDPVSLNLSIGEQDKNTLASFTDPKDDDRLSRAFMERIAVKKRTIGGVRDHRFGMDLTLKGIYIHEDRLFFQLEINNRTFIKYDVGQFRVYIRDLRKTKRTASQEIEIIQERVSGNTRNVPGFSDRTIVFELQKFTIPDKKYLSIEFLEDNGGRHLHLKVKNRKLIQALPVW
ncbi:conjugative transposon protein TraN [Aquiflexum lacus]|uniref:conjugative transposon protein TraN n=1 Tax=Aquiflexum lacus TaxID=2483805 RepID=UPI0018937808|nr:conjugative transposon protein TraN [Aquiflexum lacus]